MGALANPVQFSNFSLYIAPNTSPSQKAVRKDKKFDWLKLNFIASSRELFSGHKQCDELGCRSHLAKFFHSKCILYFNVIENLDHRSMQQTATVDQNAMQTFTYPVLWALGLWFEGPWSSGWEDVFLLKSFSVEVVPLLLLPSLSRLKCDRNYAHYYFENSIQEAPKFFSSFRGNHFCNISEYS